MSVVHRGPLLLTCEHGGARVPREFRRLFASPEAKQALASHRGHDLGALAMAEQLAASLRAPLLAATVSRLVVDLNRSPWHRAHLSEFTRTLGPEARRALIEHYWTPHRREVERALAQLAEARGRVLHVAVHAFAPEVDGVVRKADVALLYDPGRPAERALAEAWCGLLATEAPELKVRRNYPFRGVTDGLTTHLRKSRPDRAYAGLELEVNTRFAMDPRRAKWMRGVVGRTLAALTGR